MFHGTFLRCNFNDATLSAKLIFPHQESPQQVPSEGNY